MLQWMTDGTKLWWRYLMARDAPRSTSTRVFQDAVTGEEGGLRPCRWSWSEPLLMYSVTSSRSSSSAHQPRRRTKWLWRGCGVTVSSVRSTISLSRADLLMRLMATSLPSWSLPLYTVPEVPLPTLVKKA